MKKMIWFIALVSFHAAAVTHEKPLKPSALTAIKKESGQYTQICKAVENACKNGAEIWQENDADDTVYLMLPDLQLIKLKKEKTAYSKVTTWNLSKESANENSPDDGLTKDKTYLYPALYPLNKTKMAVALVTRWSTSYSGGGREEEVADFVMINDDGSYQLAFKDIPFSSREMIRACFTAADYAKTSHCHDENWKVLKLEITDTGKNFYAWKFIAKSYSWPAFTNKASVRMKTSEKVAYPFQ